jgi:4-diphosphocytidyl-2C-methyl-D-erythritol kinase
VLIPSALRRALPQFGNDVVFTLHASVVASVITIQDILGVGRTLNARYYLAYEGFVTAALLYMWLTVQESSHSIVRFCAQFARGRDTGERRNDFEGPVFARHPDLAEIRAELMARGAAWAALTGSGAAMFGVFPTGEDALQASGKMPKGMMAIPAVPLSRAAYFERMFAVGEDAQRA